MEISDVKIAIVAILLMVIALTAGAYLADAITETLVIGLASTGIAAAAGLAGYEVGKRGD